MKVLGIIPARGGSKGIPRKNLYPLRGKPLLAYTSEVALAAPSLTRVVLSTDNEEIAEHGRRLGIDVPFMRPAELSQDSTPTLPVLQDVVRRLAADGEQYDAVFTLQVTNPFRRMEDIEGPISLLQETSADSVIGYTSVGERHPARMKFLDAENRVTTPDYAEAMQWLPRQQLPPMYLRAGAVYLTRMKVLMEQDSLQGTDSRAWIIPPELALNIDEPFDLELADFLLDRLSAS